jgi:Rrf2 family protein
MFNKETEYALRGLVYIKLQNLRNHRPGTQEISSEIGAPQFYTAKILQRLARAGLVESLKGKGGGFFFDPEKPDVRLITLIKETEGSRSITGCGLGLRNCDPEHPCPLHDKYAAIREALNNLVYEESVQSLALKLLNEKKELKMK